MSRITRYVFGPLTVFFNGLIWGFRVSRNGWRLCESFQSFRWRWCGEGQRGRMGGGGKKMMKEVGWGMVEGGCGGRLKEDNEEDGWDREFLGFFVLVLFFHFL